MNTKQILIVDNNLVMLKLMTSFLEKEGHSVTYAKEGFAALDILKEVTPDIIFLDLIMPKIGGDILCKIIRTMPHLSQSYIVIVSATVLEQEIDFLALGANAVIAKGPFSLMTKYIRETIEESSATEPFRDKLVVKGTDILNAREITRDLLSQNSYLQILLESMSQGVMEIESNRVQYANSVVYSLLRINKERLLGSYLSEVLEPEIWEILGARISTCSNKSHKEEKNTPIKLYDRHIILQCLQFEEEKKRRVVLLTDITDRKQMEAIVEAANFTDNLGYIFSGIRHEIGNPVNSIKMALTLLNKNLDTYDTETVAEFVDRSLQEVERLEYLLKALKNFSLFETPNVRPVRIDLFMENFIPLVQDDLEKRNVELKTMVDGHDITALTDDRALHHVLLNLLTNAADAVEKTTFPHITISIKRESPWIIIKMNDNGCGISEADQSNLFKPFFTSKPQGTGLGLVIVRKMLMKMDSRITINSFSNFGTTVTVSLPEGI